MGKLRPFQSNFNQGEWSPILYGRSDLEGWNNALKTCQNWILLPQGGAFRRWGTRYAGEVENQPPIQLTLSAATVGTGRTATLASDYWSGTADDVGRVIYAGTGRATITGYTSATVVTVTITAGFSATVFASGAWSIEPRKARLLPFVFNETDAVVVEYGAGTIRFWRPHATTGAPERLTTGTVRIANTGVTEAQLPGVQHAQSGDVLVLTHESLTPKYIARMASDGTDWVYVEIPWTIPATYAAGHTFDNASTTMSSAAVGASTINLGTGTTFFEESDPGRLFSYRGGLGLITAYSSTTAVQTMILSAFASTALPENAWTLDGAPFCYIGNAVFANLIPQVGSSFTLYAKSANVGVAQDAFRAGDVGKYILVDDGVYQITSVVSATEITVCCLKAQTSTPDSYGIFGYYGGWELESVAWNATRGYPRAMCFHQQSTIWGGSIAEPTVLRKSCAGDIWNMGKGTLDADGTQWDLLTGKVSPIQWIAPGETLKVGTGSDVIVLKGAADNVLTPDPPLIIPSESGMGCAPITPALMQGITLFVSAGKHTLCGVGYDLKKDGFSVVNLSKMSNHFPGQITEIAAQPRLQSVLGEMPVIWCVTTDLTYSLLGFTFDPDEQVRGWHTHVMADSGVVESACVIPNTVTGYDELWLIVKRTVGGLVHRYIEVLTYNLVVDCAVSSTQASSATISGLSHLEGKTVQVLAKRASDSVWRIYPDEVVASGAITLSEAVTEFQVGLGFTDSLVTLPLAPPQTPNVFGLEKSYYNVRVKVYNTSTLTVNGYRTPDDGYTATAEYTIPGAATTDLDVINMGYDEAGSVTIAQNVPHLACVLAVYGEVDLGG